MKNYVSTEIDNYQTAKIGEIQHTHYYNDTLKMNERNKEIEKDLYANILQLTMTIKEDYPELYKYIEEMPITIPDEKNPMVTIKNLKSYFDSLNSIYNNYKLEHLAQV